ncbi:MAG: apolipoprotein N-acyltransferase [Syntrophales bacterium]|nr:apolipoprotein N-acyltransferase [Syntrophales bacterium]
MSGERGINKNAFVLAAASGILLFLSFPKFGMGIFAWVALVPLLYALKGKHPSEGLAIGFIAGLVSYIGIIYWVTFVVVHYGYLPYYVGISAMVLLAAYLSLYIALFAAGVIYFKERGIPPILVAPLLWTCLEYGKSHLLTGFPWENLAYSQYLCGPMIQVADITGIYGITFLIVLINVVFYDLLSYRRSAIGSQGSGKRLLVEVTAGCALVLICYFYGVLRIEEIRKDLREAEAMEVALIQGNIDQSIKWNPRYQDETLNVYKLLSLQMSPSGSGLIVWPETAVPFYFQDMDDLHRKVTDVAKVPADWLLFGSPSYQREEGKLSSFNSAFLLSPEGKILGRYDKVHLVPFGEYVPLKKLFPFIGKLVVGVGDFGAGKGFYPLSMDSRKVGVLICYEGIFPEASRTYKKRGADLLVNITNDAWFGRTSAPFQHLSMTAFRAVENRLYVVRAANTGISAIIDPTGEFISQTGLFKRSALRGMVKFIDKQTFYTIYGDVFVYTCLIFLSVIFLTSLKRRRQYA